MSDTPTPRTDSWKKRWNEASEGSDWHIAAVQIIESHEQLERELADAKETIKMLETRHGATMLCKLAEVTKQRDALAEALERIMNFTIPDPYMPYCDDDMIYGIAEDALASVAGGEA